MNTDPTLRDTDRKSLQECEEWIQAELIVIAQYPNSIGAPKEIIEALLAHINVMEQTLQFYGRHARYRYDYDEPIFCNTPKVIGVLEDGGERARECLQGLEGK